MVIKGLCFEGGGAAGIAHLGALEAMQDEIQHATHFVGSSAGAIVAAAMAFRTPIAKLKELLWKTKFNTFFDDSVGVLRDTVRFVREFGWYKGDALRKWIDETVAELTGSATISFEEVHEKYGTFLEITATDINEVRSKTVYYNHLTDPTMHVALAMYRSVLIPLFFGANCETKDSVFHYFCDGGAIDNYPLWRLDLYLPAEECIGFKLISTREMNEMNVKHDGGKLNVGQYIKLLITLLRTQALKSHVKSGDWERTVAIDVGTVSATDFDLSDATKTFLLQQGRDAATKFMHV